MIKAVTIIDQNVSKKQQLYIVIGIIAAVTVVAAGSFFFMYQQSTRANENDPVGIRSQPGQDSSTIAWQTAKDTIAMLEYGTTPDASTFSSSIVSAEPQKTHQIQLKGLLPNTTYYFRITAGEEVFDNSGQFYVFRTESRETPTPSQTITFTISPTISLFPSATINVSPSIASISATLIPTEMPTSTPSATIAQKHTPTLPPLSTPTQALTCSYSDCSLIRQQLGKTCTSQDYIKCILKSTPSPTSTPTRTPTPKPTTGSSSSSITVSADLQKSCAIDYLQANSCRSFSWNPMSHKGTACTDVYKKYFVQCKSSSWTSSDVGVWYCNQTTTASDITIPCSAAPTPLPGQSIFCRIRAETENGGATNATDWMYINTSCATLSSSMTQCAMNYIQSNNCRSWSWDNVTIKDPSCAAGFNKYFLQCTSDGNFTGSSGTWHCNKTFTDPYGDFPCYSAPTPADGATLTCRVRAEDAYGTDSHATSWVSATATCPTSTPTPTFTPSPTPTNTPTPTP